MTAPPNDHPLAYLEPDQLVAHTSRPLPRRELRGPGAVALWALRVFTLLVGAMVIYTFIAQIA